MPYWRRRELLAEGRERLTAALALAGPRPQTRAQALYAASLLTGEQGDGPTTRALLTESVALYRELGDERATLVALNALAVACQLMGDLAAARTHLETVLREARRVGDADNVARVPQQPGQRGPRHRRPRRGPPPVRRVPRRLRGARGPDGRGLGDQPGRRRGARRRRSRRGGRALRESLRVFREAGDGDGVATALADLARLAREDGDLDRARPAAREVLAHRLDRPARDGAGAGGAGRPGRGLGRGRSAPSSCSRPRPALRNRLGMPAPVTKRRSMWRMIEDQRALLGNAAPAAWSRGWHMSAEQVMGYASEGA